MIDMTFVFWSLKRHCYGNQFLAYPTFFLEWQIAMEISAMIPLPWINI